MSRPNLSREGPDHLLDFLFQTGDCERLYEVIVRAKLGRTLNEIAVGTAGEENEAHGLQIRIRTHDPQEFKPVDLRHIEVGDDKVRRLVPDDGIGLFGGGELAYMANPDLIKAGADQTAYRLLIVNDDDL
jgi:hypothetical protein